LKQQRRELEGLADLQQQLQEEEQEKEALRVRRQVRGVVILVTGQGAMAKSSMCMQSQHTRPPCYHPSMVKHQTLPARYRLYDPGYARCQLVPSVHTSHCCSRLHNLLPPPCVSPAAQCPPPTRPVPPPPSPLCPPGDCC
jgi:hypothetical protein